MSVAVLSLLGSVEVHYLSVTSRPTWPYKPIRFVRDTEQPFCLMIWCLFRLGWVIRVLSSEIPGEDCCKCWSKTWSDCFPLPRPQTSLSALCWKNKHGRNLDQFTVEKIQVPTVERKSIHCFKEQRTRVSFPTCCIFCFPFFICPTRAPCVLLICCRHPHTACDVTSPFFSVSVYCVGFTSWKIYCSYLFPFPLSPCSAVYLSIPVSHTRHCMVLQLLSDPGFLTRLDSAPWFQTVMPGSSSFLPPGCSLFMLLLSLFLLKGLNNGYVQWESAAVSQQGQVRELEV